MTEKLYDFDSHLKEFSASVISCERRGETYALVLDKTAFFPEGGGQESDKGTIDGAIVSDVQIKDNTIYHSVDKPFKVGQTIVGKLNWDKRFRNMQNHSGEHIISGIVHKLYGYDNVGFHLGSDEMTVDFNGELSRADLLKVEKLANEAIYKNAAFKAFYPSQSELQTLEYRSKLDLKDNVRIVTIEGYDVCACCAPHVNSACEIGLIKILDCFKNKGGVRLFVKCGYDALNDYNEKYSNVLKISNLLSVKQEETADATEKLLSIQSDLKHESAELKRRIIGEMVKSFQSESDYSAVFEDGLDNKELQLYADALCKKSGGIRGVFSNQNDKYGFAICGEENRLNEFFSGFKSTLKVRGGGRNGIVQGTVIATEEEILEKFKG